MRALAAFMRAVSKKVAMPLLAPVADDKLKMAKIEENYNNFIEEFPFDDGTQKQAPKTLAKTTNQQPAKETIEQPQTKQEQV